MTDFSYIDPGLHALAVDIRTLNPDPDNARKHSQRSLQAIVASLRQFGQRKPIVVRKDGMVVIAGNGTLEAAKMLEWTHLAAVVVDVSENDAKAFAIADNRTAELSEWEEGVLKATLVSLTGEKNDGSLDPLSLGFTDKEFNDLFSGTAGAKGEGDGSAFQHIGVSQRLGESYDYIVLMFRTSETFTSACDVLGVQRVNEKPYVPAKKPKIGIGRVIDGADFLRRFTNRDVPGSGTNDHVPQNPPVSEGAGPTGGG